MSISTLFELGQVVATPGAIEALGGHPDGCTRAIGLVIRHNYGDWGDIDPEDTGLNEAAIANGDRILSVYNVNDVKFYVITEADRSVTTVLLPSEY
jgi:hypothetical protein